jgi:hypothetical protein
MKKLRLALETLKVETFAVKETGGGPRATVRAHAEAEPTNWPDDTCRLWCSNDSYCAWGTTCYQGENGTC